MSKRASAYYIEQAEQRNLDAYPTIFDGYLIPLLVDDEGISFTRASSIRDAVADRYAGIVQSLYGFVVSASVVNVTKVAETDWRSVRKRHVKSLVNLMIKFSTVGSIEHLEMD